MRAEEWQDLVGMAPEVLLGGYAVHVHERLVHPRVPQLAVEDGNAYECYKANELIEQGLIRPVLWRTMGFDEVGEAHQLMRENKHLGKIAILVGAKETGQGKVEEGPGAIYAEVGV